LEQLLVSVVHERDQFSQNLDVSIKSS